jgi:hypothetical protein
MGTPGQAVSGQALEALVEANKNQRALATSSVGYTRYPTLVCSLGNILALIDLVMFSRKQNLLITTSSMARVDKTSA